VRAESAAGVSRATVLADRLKQKPVRGYHRQVCILIIAIIDIITAGEIESHTRAAIHTQAYLAVILKPHSFV